MGKDVGKGMTSEDIATYLMLMDGEAVEETIRNWGEEIAYELYVTETFTHLNGYVLYYIFEIVTENMKLNYFENEVGRVTIKYLEEVKKGNHIGGKALLSREVTLTNKRDMRECGEDTFKTLIKKYVEDSVEVVSGTDGYGWFIELIGTIEYIIQFTYFAYQTNLGVLTEEGYQEVKDFILELLYESVEEDTQGKNGVVKRGNYVYNRVKDEYKRVEGA